MCAELIATTFVSLTLRSIISLNSYSGYKSGPMYGDYEAQRHWQEVTVNLHIKQWYTNGTHNDLQYWGLDYPPLTAYHSYLLGRIARALNYSYVELHASRGIETTDHKSFMRFTVLIADVLVYLPAILIMSVCMDRTFQKHSNGFLFLLSIYPGQVLIDNGHFQYNNISLGLTFVAISAVLCNKHFVAAFTFTLALNYKQMELYYALPFFTHILSASMSHKSYKSFVKELTKIAAVVLAVFTLLWYPWLDSVNSTLQVLHRLFPLGRGVFEDKVANFWCSVNVIYKLKKHIFNREMALICCGSTLLGALPANVLFFWRRSNYLFILTLFNTASAFFLFSFQVHEKSVLLIALPSICLFNWWQTEMLWFLQVSVFSMMPLLKRDGLFAPAISLMIIFYLTFQCRFFKCNEKIMPFLGKVIKSSEITMIFTLLAYIILKPSSRFPDFWPLIISIISCAHIFMFLLWGYYQQFKNRIFD